MPSTPQGRVSVVAQVSEPEIIHMEMPPGRRSRREVGATGMLIDRLKGGGECVFIPANGVAVSMLASRASSLIAGAQKRNPGAKYTRRVCKCGTVEGVGIWRTQ